MSTFPTLYGEASTGKCKQWTVRVDTRDNTGVICVCYGYKDSKQQVNERIVSKGKNIGKSNETTAVQQAVLEAQSLWNKKRDSGYNEVEHSRSVVSAPVPLPMLAHDYQKRAKSITFPCYAQRKLDGVRCVAIANIGLYSRNGKPLSSHLTHIQSELNSFAANTILDGELYSDELTFQEIVGLVKKETLKHTDIDKIRKIYLCVYDTIQPDTIYIHRKEWLEHAFASNTRHSLRLLETDILRNCDEIKLLHAKYVEEGYEGLILRNTNGIYAVGHRSADLQKYKEFIDDEFIIIGFKEGDGIEKGCVVWKCRTKEGCEFDCRPRGSHEERMHLYAHAADYVGKQLTVRFQEWTDDKKPRFPVGISIRDYE